MENIIIRSALCTVTIFAHAHLTNISMGDFWKLLKMAAVEWYNHPHDIKKQLLEQLQAEEQDAVREYENGYITNKRYVSWIRKIEKYRLVVESWEI